MDTEDSDIEKISREAPVRNKRPLVRKRKVLVPRGGLSLGLLEPNPPSIYAKEEFKDFLEITELFEIAPACACRPTERQRPDWDVYELVCFYEIAFSLGLRLPLHPFLRSVFLTLGIAPGQLLPNGWRLLLGLLSLSDHGIEITINTLLDSYSLRHEEKGRVKFYKRPHKLKLVLMPPSGFDGDTWKKRYFFVKSRYAFGTSDFIYISSKWKIEGWRRAVLVKNRGIDKGVEAIQNIPERDLEWFYLLRPDTLIYSDLWEDLLQSGTGTEKDYLKNFMDKLKGIELPDIGILCGNIEDARKATVPRKRKNCASGSSLAVVEAESGVPLQRFDMDGLEEGFSTMTLFEGACLHSDKGAFRGEEGKLLLPADDRFLADMDLGEALQHGVIDSLRGAQTFLYAKKNVEALLSQRSSLLEDKQGLEERVEALKKELENERANHEVAMKEVVDEMRAAAGVLAKEQVARAKLVMMKQYETGKHKNWRVKEEIKRCILDLGDEAAPILKRFEEADEVSGDNSPEI